MVINFRSLVKLARYRQYKSHVGIMIRGTFFGPRPVRFTKVKRKFTERGRVAARLLVMATAVLLAVSPTGCAQVLAGAITAGQVLFLTEQTETALGRQAAEDFVRENPPVRIQAVQDELQRVGKIVAARSSRPDAAYAFTAVTGEAPNAFALPGGPIFVSAGLLKRMKDEAQLAGVLAHEVAHVAERHGLNRLREALVLQGIAIAALGNQPELLRRAAAIALDLFRKGRDRGSERDADLLGARWMAAAGYDPKAMIDTLGMFKSIGDVPGWLVWASDHPALDDRIRDVNAIIAQEGLKGGVRNAAQYQEVMAPLGN